MEVKSMVSRISAKGQITVPKKLRDNLGLRPADYIMRRAGRSRRDPNGGRAQARPILLDIQLPIMDGYAVARELRANPDLAAIPIVAVTSYAMAGDRDKSIAAGCNGYIEKPINPDTFVPEVEQHLLSNICSFVGDFCSCLSYNLSPNSISSHTILEKDLPVFSAKFCRVSTKYSGNVEVICGIFLSHKINVFTRIVYIKKMM